MIEMQYNFPLLPGQGEQWQQRLRAAVDNLHVADPNELRPTYRGGQAALRAIAARWIGSTPATTWIVASGHHGSLVALLAANLAGKTIAVEGITYGGILQQGRLLACPLVPLAFDAEGMTPESLRAACNTHPVAAIYAMPTVHNPLGFTTGLPRRQAITAIAREFDLLILEDDAYGYMDPSAPAPYRELAPERTFYIRALSKSCAPATRTGFLAAPERYASDIALVLQNTASGTSLVHNAAAISLIADGSLQHLIDQKLAEGARRTTAARKILGQAAAPGCRTGWHLWLSLPGGMDSVTAQRLCEQQEVLVSGGHSFAVPGVEAQGLRVALGGEVDFDRMMHGIHTVANVLRIKHPDTPAA